MIDHVANLRAAAVLLDTEECAAFGLAGTATVCRDGADEIERLRDALTQAIGWIEECGSDHEGRQYVLTEARAALKGFTLTPHQATDDSK